MKNIPLADVMRKGEEFESEDKYAEAYECYKYVHGKDKTDEEALSKLALCAQCLEKKDEAINYWNSLINIDPTNHLPYTQLMDIYFHDDKYMYYMVRARLKTLDGQFSQVADDYKKAMSNTDDTQKIASARFLLAQMHEVNNKPMQAIDEYLRILDQDKNEAAYAALAAIYYNTDKSSAVHTLEQAIKHFPDNVLFKELLSKVYMETGDFEGAMKYAEDPMTQAKTLLLQEKNEEAFKILDKLP